MNRFRLSYALLSTSLVALAGCSGADDTWSSESDLRVDPKSSNDAAPTVTMKLPNGVAEGDLAKCDLANGAWTGMYFWVNGVRKVTPSETWTVFPGDVDVVLDWCINKGARATKLRAKLGKAYTVDLTAFTFKYDELDLYLGSIETADYKSLNIQDGKWFVTLPGAMDLKFGLMDGLRIKGKAGDKYKLATSNFDGRQGVRIISPVRELPNCKNNIFYEVSATGRQQSWSRETVTEEFSKNGLTQVFGYNPSVWGKPYDASEKQAPNTIAYTLKIASDQYADGVTVPLPMSKVGDAPIDFKIGRLDINDVKHTGPNGQEETIRGTYQVYRFEASGRPSQNPFIQQCKTNTGIDVPPGKYKVVVVYEANGAKVSENIVTVP